MCPTLCDPMDYSLPGSSVHWIFQARILEWVAISFPGGSSQPRDRTRVSCIVGRWFTIWATREVLFLSCSEIPSSPNFSPEKSFQVSLETDLQKLWGNTLPLVILTLLGNLLFRSQELRLANENLSRMRLLETFLKNEESQNCPGSIVFYSSSNKLHTTPNAANNKCWWRWGCGEIAGFVNYC